MQDEPAVATTVGGSSPLPVGGRDPWTRLAVRIRGALVVGWVLFLAAGLLVGERQATFDDLEAAVAAGDVRAVALTEGLPPEARGSRTVTLRWREGLVRYRTTVVEASSRRAAGERSVGDQPPVLLEDPASRLTRSQPGLELRKADEPGLQRAGLLGWEVSGGWAWLATALGIATFLFVLVSPEPWRATRWAWVWLLLLATPVGLVGYLLLAGPTPFVAAPRHPARRLTGGWAFVLGMLLGGAVGGPAGG